MLGMRGRIGERHLVRAEGAFHAQPIDDLGPCPALGRIQHDHRPARARRVGMGTGLLLDLPNLLDYSVERRGHGLVHEFGFMPLDKVRRPAVTAEQLFQLFVFDTGQDGRVGDLVAVEVQDGQHRAVADRVEKLVGMPGRGQRAGFRLAVADHTGDHEIWIVQHRAERVAERIAQLAALMDRAGALRRGVTGNSAGEGELQEEFPQPGLVLADIWINLAVGAFEIGVCHDGRPAVPGTGDVNHVEVVLLDDPVQVRVNEVLAGRGAPVSQQHVLHVRERQWPLQQRVVVKIDLTDRQVIGGPPVGVDFLK